MEVGTEWKNLQSGSDKKMDESCAGYEPCLSDADAAEEYGIGRYQLFTFDDSGNLYCRVDSCCGMCGGTLLYPYLAAGRISDLYSCNPVQSSIYYDSALQPPPNVSSAPSISDAFDQGAAEFTSGCN